MSNALALAAVSAVLKDLLDNAMNDHDATTAVGSPVKVSVRPPDRVRLVDGDPPQLNLFLFQVTPNQGWRNVGLPSRNGEGERISNPPLALNLHYLLTAYAMQDFQSELLLGYAMQVLHETPVLPRDAIRSSLGGVSPIDGSSLPGPVSLESAKELAEQVEQLKITPESLSTEEMAKLWPAFQASYRPSAVYQVSVVLIESKRPTRNPLPVLTRGAVDTRTGRDRGVIAQANLVPPYPTLQSATPPGNQPSLRIGEVLAARGHHLAGDQVTARFTLARLDRLLELPVSAESDTGFQVQFPTDPPSGPAPPIDSPQNPDNWPAGLYSLAGVIQRAGQPTRTTNELPVVLTPSVSSINATITAGMVTFTVGCRPKVWQSQRVSLVVGDREIPAEPISAAKTATLTFKAGGLPSGPQRFRLRVDGVDSLLVDFSKTPPEFLPSQTVPVP